MEDYEMADRKINDLNDSEELKDEAMSRVSGGKRLEGQSTRYKLWLPKPSTSWGLSNTNWSPVDISKKRR